MAYRSLHVSLHFAQNTKQNISQVYLWHKCLYLDIDSFTLYPLLHHSPFAARIYLHISLLRLQNDPTLGVETVIVLCVYMYVFLAPLCK